MFKKSIAFLLVLTFLLGNFVGYTVFANEQEESSDFTYRETAKIVDRDKVWEVKFNSIINEDTITKENIYVENNIENIEEIQNTILSIKQNEEESKPQIYNIKGENNLSLEPYTNILNSSVKIQGDKIILSMYLRDIPETILFNKADTPNNVMEYAWGVRVGVDKSGGYEISGRHFKFSGTKPEYLPIEKGVQGDVWVMDKHPTEARGVKVVSGLDFLHIDYEENLFQIIGTIPNLIGKNIDYIEVFALKWTEYSGIVGDRIILRDLSLIDEDDPTVIEDEDSDEMLYVKNLLQNSLVNADSESKKSIQNAIHNLLFKAQFRPTESRIPGDMMKYTGTLAVNKMWPVQNKDGYARSVYDKVLGQIKFTEGAAGCMSYALFATAYTYGTSGTAKMCEDRTASGIKKHLHRYVDPGEQIRYRHPTNNHSIVFLGESGNGEGFYYISYDGGKTSTGGESHGLYVGYQTYNDFARKVTTSLSVRDTNGGSYYKGGTVKSVEKVRTGVGATSMVLRIDCPVEAIIKLGNEILDSRNPGRTSFGIVEKIEDQIIFKVDYNEDYELIIDGKDEGNMTLTLEYYTDDTQIDKRTFIDFPIESTTQITSSGFDPQASFVLYSDIGTPNEQTWGAGENETVYDTDIDFSSTYNAVDDDTDIDFTEWDSGEEKIVEKDKIWTIKFNAKIDASTLKSNIYVEDKANTKQDISLSLSEYGKSVLVSPPNGGYENGKEYTLYITNEIKDESGRQLAKPIKMKFNITKH